MNKFYLNEQEKQYLLDSIDDLISNYKEYSCIKININVEMKRHCYFIECSFNEITKKYKKRMVIYLQEDFSNLLSKVFVNYLRKNIKDLEEELKNNPNLEEFTFTLLEWKELINEYSK